MIVLNINDKEYKLEYTLAVIKQMDFEGFDIEHIEDHKIASLVDLLVYAFKKHHPDMTEDEVFELLPYIDNVDELLAELVKMYSNVFAVLSGNGKKGDSKSKNWKVSK